MKPRVFIGSTSEGRAFAEAIVVHLGTEVHSHPWHQGIFELSGNIQASLLREVSSCDFAIIVLTADDATTSRGKDYLSPRDNLIFEAGLCFGAVAPARTFLVPERCDGLKMPSDLNGFTVTQPFDSLDPPKNAMVAPVAAIRQRIQEMGVRPLQHYTGSSDRAYPVYCQS